MATTPDQIAVSYPIPTYRFIVTVGEEKLAFNSVSGLDIGFETISYQDGAGGYFQMPGQSQAVNISLKRGVVKGQKQFYTWINSITLNQVEKKDISISLTNDAGNELLVTWNVSNAFPTKLSAPNFDASSNEVAIEELSLVADRLSVEFH